MTARIRSTGEFCWINILTPDLQAAQGFFRQLLGWTYTAAKMSLAQISDVIFLILLPFMLTRPALRSCKGVPHRADCPSGDIRRRQLRRGR